MDMPCKGANVEVQMEAIQDTQNEVDAFMQLIEVEYSYFSIIILSSRWNG